MLLRALLRLYSTMLELLLYPSRLVCALWRPPAPAPDHATAPQKGRTSSSGGARFVVMVTGWSNECSNRHTLVYYWTWTTEYSAAARVVGGI